MCHNIMNYQIDAHDMYGVLMMGVILVHVIAISMERF